MTNITTSDVEREVRKLAAYFPNVVYQKPDSGECLYLSGECIDKETGETVSHGCIVGQAFCHLGMRKEMMEFDAERETPNASGVLRELAIPGPAAFLCIVQSMQDSSSTWGDSVQVAGSCK